VSIAPRDPHEPITDEQWAELRSACPDAGRIDVAFRLALDVATFDALLRGEPVDPDRIDKDGLRWARERRFVQLARPIDLLLEGAA
jgi:hypothetical protein